MSEKTATPAPSEWRNRIVGYGEEAPDALRANPKNWRVHPKNQSEALTGLLAEVGWVQNVIVNRTTGNLVDGHARLALAIQHKEPAVPVTYVELTEDEEALVLASLDPLAAMAGIDGAKLDALLGDAKTNSDALSKMLASMKPKDDGSGTRRTRLPTPTVAYNLIFETDAQQQVWFEFLRWLRVRYPTEETIAGRLVEHMQAAMK